MDLLKKLFRLSSIILFTELIWKITAEDGCEVNRTSKPNEFSITESCLNKPLELNLDMFHCLYDRKEKDIRMLVPVSLVQGNKLKSFFQDACRDSYKKNKNESKNFNKCVPREECGDTQKICNGKKTVGLRAGTNNTSIWKCDAGPLDKSTCCPNGISVRGPKKLCENNTKPLHRLAEKSNSNRLICVQTTKKISVLVPDFTSHLEDGANINPLASELNLNILPNHSISTLNPLIEKTVEYLYGEYMEKIPTLAMIWLFQNENAAINITVISLQDVNGTLGTIAISSDCNDLVKFDGIDTVQNRTSYATFSKQISFTISQQSQPALDPGKITYIALYLDSEKFEEKKPLTFRIMIKPLEKELFHVYIMTVLSVFLGLMVLIWYHCIFFLTRGHTTMKKKISLISTVVNSWFNNNDQTYTYLTLIFIIIFFIPGVQIVIENYLSMKMTGNRDKCFYNELCYIPLGYGWNVPINALASNIPYMLHGVMLILYTFYLEINCKSQNHKFYDYSTSYALGIALTGEGVFSCVYHICPTRSIFQMDTACMFLISALLVVSVYYGWSFTKNDKDLAMLLNLTEVNSNDYVVKHMKYWKTKIQKNPRQPIPALKLFLFFISPLLIFNYAGSLINMDLKSKEIAGLKDADNPLKAIFGPLEAIWFILLVCWACNKNQMFEKKSHVVDKEDHERKELKRLSLVVKILLGLTAVANFTAVMACFLEKIDFSQIFLFGCIGVSMISLLATEKKFRIQIKYKYEKQRENDLYTKEKEADRGETIFLVLSRLYYLLFFLVWFGAFYFFVIVGSSDKSAQPHVSRTKNKPCVIFIWGPHDVWHFLSSLGLLMTALRGLSLGFPCRRCRLDILYYDPDGILMNENREEPQDVEVENELEMKRHQQAAEADIYINSREEEGSAGGRILNNHEEPIMHSVNNHYEEPVDIYMNFKEIN